MRKSLKKPDLPTNELGHRKNFFQGGNSVLFRWSGPALASYCYNTRLHCSFRVMTCCNIFSFVDILLFAS